jgi:hypothetical protein
VADDKKKDADPIDAILEEVEKGRAPLRPRRYGGGNTDEAATVNPEKVSQPESWSTWIRKKVGLGSNMPKGATLSPKGDLGKFRQMEAKTGDHKFKGTKLVPNGFK